MSDDVAMIEGQCAGCRQMVASAATATSVTCPHCNVVTRFETCPHCGKTHRVNQAWSSIKCPATGKDFRPSWISASAVATPAPTPPPPRTPAQKRHTVTEWVNFIGSISKLILLGFVVVAVVAVGLAIALHKDAGPFTASVDKIVMLDSDQVSIVVTAHDVGRSGKASCTVSAWGEGQDPYEIDTWDLKSMGNGDYRTFPAVMHVENGDAAEIDHAKATCKPT